MRGDQPFGECIINRRYTKKKGWGGGIYYGLSNVGEIFVYHTELDRKSNFHDHSGERKSKFLPPFFEAETVKLLNIAKDKKLSTHFHIKKEELFYLVVGELQVNLIKDGEIRKVILEKNDGLLIKPGMVHSMKGLGEENILLEVSTLDKPEDSYRIAKGD